MAQLPQTNTTLSRYLRQQKRQMTRLANSTPYALSGTSVVAPGLTTVDERLVAGTPGGSRVELDSAGLRKYAADGTTVQVDLTGEVAAFSGLITGSEIVGSELRTASSGARVEIGQGTGSGVVLFYTAAVNEYWPAYMAAGATGDNGFVVLSGPDITGSAAALFVLTTGAESAAEIHADSIETDTTALEWAVANGYGNLKRCIFVVADATERAALMARYIAAPLSRVIDSTHPLFIWKADEAPGAQLQYTVNGTTFAAIGGGGGTTLFADPNADRLVFWDDSAGAFAALTASTGLTLTGTDLTVRAATDALMGGVELATSAETVTGTDDTRATTPAGVKAAGQVWSRLDTTNALGTVRRQWGIARLTAPGGTNRATPLTVTFPVAFSGIPHVTAGALGYRATGAWNPTGLTAGTTEQWFVPVTGRSTTAMILNIVDVFSASISAGYDLYVSWEAVGPA